MPFPLQLQSRIDLSDLEAKAEPGPATMQPHLHGAAVIWFVGLIVRDDRKTSCLPYVLNHPPWKERYGSFISPVFRMQV